MRHNFVTLPQAAALSIAITLLGSMTAAAQTATPGGSPIQTTPTSVPTFAQQLAGRTVWITADGARLRGVVTSLNATSLVLVEDGAPTTIPYSKIVRVERSSHRLRNGTLIGLASGAGLGLAVGAAFCGGDEYCDPGTIVALSAFYGGLGAAAGVGVGAIVNASKKSGDVIYDARRGTTTMSLAPILSPTRKGMAFRMTWR